ncbi:MAG: 3-dehydroquinate synthase II family protein [Actinobacteria bacterium]|nr:3-dehydroquinate synthase II family protein [Actinomycetota bacterium]
MKRCWIDVRRCNGMKEALLEAAIHQRVDAVLSDHPADLAAMPPTVTRVLFQGHDVPTDAGAADIVLLPASTPLADAACLPKAVVVGRYVDVVDAETLDLACRTVREVPVTVLRFQDPTKIPLEIVLAAGARDCGEIITVAADVEEAQIVFGVLERGATGVLLAPTKLGDVAKLKEATAVRGEDLALEDLRITKVSHVGMGDRACIDTCSYLGKDEGILVGSHALGMILCVSETHPLPYMPTRPFRVNAGAVMSYTFAENGRTAYLTELRSGSKVTAVSASGKTRIVTVGRVKIERRPLLSIDAVAAGGQEVNLIVQDDWHVRVLGRGPVVHNSTELAPGDTVLGFLSVDPRHVGFPIDEFLLEQ